MDKDEWKYLAAILIFGPQKVRCKELSIYSIDVFRDHKDLNVKTISSIDPVTGKLESKRNLKIRPHLLLTASHVQASSDVAKILSFQNEEKNIHISDAIFTDREFELTGFSWDRLVESRISKLGILINAIFYQKMDELPLLINEFPNLTGLLLKSTEYWS